ncbi:MAG TPA: diguanylate cyclase [Gaiellaceae bacterium]|nr:diguanylate cyclase [Gaiellaceae bacterium]HET8653028.1 diguanylate cyclase [Gaiellaceae bacterium]
MGSFKLKLVAYFSLIALLPFAAAFSGLEAVTDRNETRRVDGTLETSARAAQAAFVDEVAQAQGDAQLLARDPSFQRALATRNRAKLKALASLHGVRVEPRGGEPIGVVRRPAFVRSITVVGRRGRLGRVIAPVPIDRQLARKIRDRAGLTEGGQVAFVEGGRVLAASSALAGTIRAPAEPQEIEVSGRRFRALASHRLAAPRSTALVVMAPQSRIDESVGWLRSRMFLAMLAALLLIAAVAYIQGRTIVGTLGRLAEAARGIARGRLGDRVHVRGRDEFASLAHAFNQMADQLEARLHELEEERRRLRETTLRFGEALAATHDVDQLLRVIVDTAVQATGATRGELTDGGVVLIAHGGDRTPEKLEFPLSAGRENFGTLVLYGEKFTGDQRESAGWLVGHAVIALSNARQHRTVEQQALVDSLTGLANRRLCTAALEKELARAERFEEPLTLVLADIDDFKTINDRWGHPTGDEVLRAFAKQLRESVREIDLAGRWGGEEFVLLLPGTDLEGGRQLAERIRELLAVERPVAADGERIRLTASFGVASFPLVKGQNQLVAAADAALYEAKRTGKDRVVTAPSAVPATT